MDKLLRAVMAATELGAFYENARSRPRRIILALAAGWVASLFALLALLWFDAALWFYCEPRLGAPIAALIAGGALLLAALIAILVILIGSQRREPPAASPAFDAQALAGAAVELDRFVREHKALILAGAAVAGLVFGTRKK
ncbi:MAG TPA: hypothetical protein VN632_03455 [Stellaceae bacterium]|nr:hypothetical protein [Stellaceae bacterium]